MKNFLKTTSILFASTLLFTGCTLFNTPNQTSTEQSTQTQDNVQNQKFSLKEALSLGQSTKCTYNAEGDDITVLIKDKKMRVDGITYNPDSEASEKGGVINDGEWVYIWGEGQKVGMKYKLSDLEEIAKDSTQGEEWGDPETWANEAEEKYDISCSPSIATDSQFVPPSDIEFEDLGQLMKGLEGLIPTQGSAPDTSGVNMDELNKAIQEMGIETEE